jgi:uncharacterized membrane protein YedE/YeeE
MDSFTPIASSLGGAILGLSAALLLLWNGKIAGISGIAGGLFGPAAKSDTAWRVAFLGGMVVTGLIAGMLAPAALENTVGRSSLAIVAAGLLVGIGTRVGNGCTSGHGVCGLSRLSVRSLAATVTFMATAGVTVFVFNHMLGGAQ